MPAIRVELWAFFVLNHFKKAPIAKTSAKIPAAVTSAPAPGPRTTSGLSLHLYDAKQRNGVLKLTIAKKEEVKPVVKTIAIA